MSALIASCLGLGRLRPAPGTWASAAALLAAWPILSLGGAPALAVAFVIVVALALLCVGPAIAGQPDQDPAWIVIDEVAGQWVALSPVAWGAWSRGFEPLALWPGWVAAFVLFRLFDVWKPGPVGWADRRGGAGGVLLDDLVAGLLAAAGVVALGVLYHVILFA